MSSSPKGTSLIAELLRAVTKLSSGVIGNPTSPGPVVDARDGKRRPTRP